MSAQFIGTNFAVSNGGFGGADTLSVTVPSGAQAGDTLIALCNYGQGSSTSTLGPIAPGWTQVGGTFSGKVFSTTYIREVEENVSGYNFQKIIDGSTREASAALIVIRGVIGDNFVHNHSGSSNIVFPPLASTEEGIVIRAWSWVSPITLADPDAAWTAIGSAVETVHTWQESFYHLKDAGASVSSYDTEFEASSSVVTQTLFLPVAPGVTARKGSTATVTHTLTADGITTATLDGETVTIGTQSGQDADINLDETAITTSGEYDLVLGDGVDTETFTVQYNVIGLTTNTIQKDGASIGAQTDVEMHILDATGATVLGNLTGLTTDASGITGQTIVPAGAVDDSVRVIGFSDTAEIGFAYKTTLGLL